MCLFLCTAFKCTRWCFSLTRCAGQTVRKFKLKKDVPPLTKWTFIWNSLRHQLPKWNFETRGHIFFRTFFSVFFHLCRHTVGMGHLPHCHNLKDIRTFTINIEKYQQSTCWVPKYHHEFFKKFCWTWGPRRHSVHLYDWRSEFHCSDDSREVYLGLVFVLLFSFYWQVLSRIGEELKP